MRADVVARGLVAGAAGVAAMTLAEKLEQAFTGRPNSYVPAHTLERLTGLPARPDDERLWLNWAMHWGQGIALGAVRALMAERASADRSGLSSTSTCGCSTTSSWKTPPASAPRPGPGPSASRRSTSCTRRSTRSPPAPSPTGSSTTPFAASGAAAATTTRGAGTARRRVAHRIGAATARPVPPVGSRRLRPRPARLDHPRALRADPRARHADPLDEAQVGGPAAGGSGRRGSSPSGRPRSTDVRVVGDERPVVRAVDRAVAVARDRRRDELGRHRRATPGRSKSSLTSLTKVECQSPVITTGFATAGARSWSSRRRRASG